jgi:XTP/dITP diphosphohydrolase
MLQIRNITDRSARFRCCIIVLSDQCTEWIFEGTLEGQIAMKESGMMGFGYDSIFIPKGETKTLAELEPSFKNKYSHRALAIQQFIQKFSN